METFLGIGALALVIGAYVAYSSWLTRDGLMAAVQAEDRRVHLRTGELRGR